MFSDIWLLRQEKSKHSKPAQFLSMLIWAVTEIEMGKKKTMYFFKTSQISQQCSYADSGWDWKQLNSAL